MYESETYMKAMLACEAQSTLVDMKYSSYIATTRKLHFNVIYCNVHKTSFKVASASI